ncbi:MAG TPA: heme ABC exporter ATP-binding protein CcmA [Acidimicrobiales bacterium]|jgi:heme ABC exporter ATP-binding subunit CcmA|nr:heme ABC exporter ATP-binding protein CcmA [Acidimicrobiales bacterium]
MEHVIHFRQAVSLLGRFPALAGVDLDVAHGEIVLVQGANGAGKTTLLRSCAGLLPIVSGEASVLGHDLRVDRRGVRHRVGMLGHATGLYDDLTVADNVRFWARAVRARDVDAGAAMERLGLSGRLAGVLVGRLSAGQRRRTALACLVARRPELWLLDEPHAGLDAAGRDTIDEIVRAAAAAGATVLVASHELERAGGLADRRIVLSGGMVVHDEAVEAAPASAPAAPADAEAEAEVAPAVTCAS